MPACNLPKSIENKMVAGLRILIFFAVLSLIVYKSCETSSPRRDRSSNPRINAEAQDNFNGYQDDKSALSHSFSTSQRQSSQNGQIDHSLHEKILSIFGPIPPEGSVVFDKTFTDRSLSNQNSGDFTKGDSFKVQRTPDDKLIIVFNENSFLQPRPSTASEIPTKKTNTNNDAILFPGSRPRPNIHSTSNSNPSVPDCMDKMEMQKGYCTNVNNYPDLSQYENYLKEEFGAFFGKDDILPENFSQRTGASVNEDFLCQSEETVVFPQVGQTPTSDWKYIVQGNSTLTQGVRIETCKNETATCKYMEGLPEGKTAHCKQNYMLRTLIARGENNEFVKQSFRLPSCCKCVIVSK